MMGRAGQILVQRAMLKQEADRLHLQVSDDDLIRELKTGPFAQYLFPNGKFIGDDGYINFIQEAIGQDMSRADFEDPGEGRYGAAAAAGADHRRSDRIRCRGAGCLSGPGNQGEVRLRGSVRRTT